MKNDNSIPLKVAIYIRVSTEDQAEKYGPDLQRESARSFIKSKGKLDDAKTDAYILAGEEYIYVDDISGSTYPEDRPAFSRLQEDVLNAPEGRKPFDAVVVYKIDRFARRLRVLLDIVDFFEENEIKFMSANESIDTSTPFGRAILGILGIISELEIENIKLRTQDGRAEANKKGVIMGGSAPYGYRKNSEKQPVILQEEAEVVESIFDYFVRLRWTSHRIAQYLTENKFLSPDASAVKRGKRKGNIKKKNKASFWRAEKITSILSNRFYIGEHYYGKYNSGKRVPKKDWKLSPHRHTPIIDILTFEKAQKLLKSTQIENSASRRKKQDKHLYLLSGLLKCDCCKEDSIHPDDFVTWTGSKKKKGNSISYSYLCIKKNKSKFSNPCTSIPLPADQIEEKVVKLIQKLIESPLATFEYQKRLKSTKLEANQLNNKLERYQKLFNSTENKIERVKEQHRESIITTDELKTQSSFIKEEKKKYDSEIKRLQGLIAQTNLSKGYYESLKLFGDHYAEMLNDLNKDRDKIFDVLHALISHIVVYSRPVTNNDTVSGKKKKDQQIPYKVELSLRLPKEIMNELQNRFRVISVDL